MDIETTTNTFTLQHLGTEQKGDLTITKWKVRAKYCFTKEDVGEIMSQFCHGQTQRFLGGNVVDINFILALTYYDNITVTDEHGN